jgi:hypothetical protein
VDQDGEAAGEHSKAEGGRVHEMVEVAFADLFGVSGKGIACHGFLAGAQK